MRRGDLVTIAVSGDYGKPRPALVIQSDAFAALPSVTVLPLTSDLHDAPLVRLTVRPTPENGLRTLSQIMVDKVMTVPRSRVGAAVGLLDGAILADVDDALGRFLGVT